MGMVRTECDLLGRSFYGRSKVTLERRDYRRKEFCIPRRLACETPGVSDLSSSVSKSLRVSSIRFGAITTKRGAGLSRLSRWFLEGRFLSRRVTGAVRCGTYGPNSEWLP